MASTRVEHTDKKTGGGLQKHTHARLRPRIHRQEKKLQDITGFGWPESKSATLPVYISMQFYKCNSIYSSK